MKAKGKQNAAKKIQSFFRMTMAKRYYNKLNILICKVKKIQRYWKRIMLKIDMKKQIQSNNMEKI
jgi:hypothetical protein